MTVASVIVLAHGNRAVTERCVGTLEEALGDELGHAFELVLVDNGSPDDTAELFDRWSDRAVVVSLSTNRNFAGGCNAGASAASGDVLVFLNNDTEVPAGAIEALVEHAREPGVGVVGLRLLYPDGTIQHAGVVHREAYPGFIAPFHLFHHEAGDMPLACSVYDLDAVTGACLAIPRPLFQELGGFDERYINGLEDIDLCLRARVAGHRVVYRGDAHVVHHERQTRGAAHDDGENHERFLNQWGELLADDGEALTRLFDLHFGPPIEARYAGDHMEGSPLSVAGRLRSGSAEAFEARALLAAFDAAGIEIAARDWQPQWESPRSSGSEWEVLLRAEKRPLRPDARTIRVVGGALWSLPAGMASIARVPTLPAARGRLDADAVWAASPWLVDELVREGMSADRVSWLPPAMPELSVGPGGEGTLVLFPSHDLAVAKGVLTSLRDLGGSRVRVLPNVGGAVVEAVVREILPEAEVLDPAIDERRFAELTAVSDVVCGTHWDAFDRRALIAAGTGAAVMTRAYGPAAGVLGTDLAVTRWDDARLMRGALERAFEQADARRSRADAVRTMCGSAALAERLADLLEGVEARRRPVVSSVVTG